MNEWLRRSGIGLVLVLASTTVAGAELPTWLETPEWSRQTRWMVGVGWFGLRPEDPKSPIVDLEFRGSEFWYGIYPAVGALVNGDEAYHFRLGFGRDFELGERWGATVSLAAGYYDQGESKDLGHEVEFRSALDVTYRVKPRLQIGLTIAHLSNSALSDLNPGVENLSLTFVYRP